MTSPTGSSARCSTPQPDVFRLVGPTVVLDPRVNAYRADLADVALAGRRFAPHYAKFEPTVCVASSAMIVSSPSDRAQAVSQLVHGEAFALLDRSGEWAWGRCEHDGYVGYLRSDALGPSKTPGWRVTASMALAFADGNIKAPVIARHAIGARLEGQEAGDFVRSGGGFIHRRHLAPIGDRSADWVAAAERLVGLPYLWGGRGAGGIDCSGLVQVALGLAGIPAPRDSDQQRDALGEKLAPDVPSRRGDLVFIPGHVGIMLDADRLLHANAFWMAVTIEPLAAVLARMRLAEMERRRIG